jgi:RNA polymerase sigma factor for flagellar operon FliA
MGKGNRDEMITRNLPLVSFVVRRMGEQLGASAISSEDAFAHGVEGLIHAVDHYDDGRGVTFGSFAYLRIRGAVLDAVRQRDVLSRSLRRKASEIERTSQDLASEKGSWPTRQELADRLGISQAELLHVQGQTSVQSVSLERLLDSTEGESHWEAPDPDETSDPEKVIDRRAVGRLLREAVTTLDPRERMLVKLRYSEAKGFGEIGRLMNISESRVCQLHKRIVKTLKVRLQTDFGLAA